MQGSCCNCVQYLYVHKRNHIDSMLGRQVRTQAFLGETFGRALRNVATMLLVGRLNDHAEINWFGRSAQSLHAANLSWECLGLRISPNGSPALCACRMVATFLARGTKAAIPSWTEPRPTLHIDICCTMLHHVASICTSSPNHSTIQWQFAMKQLVHSVQNPLSSLLINRDSPNGLYGVDLCIIP